MIPDRDRYLGALVGLAVGDALGAPLEFTQRDAAPAVTGMRGGGKFDLKPGQWTDDTSMALCIASSLIETGTFDLRDQLDRFLRWRDEGYLTSRGKCFGIGQQTFWALSDFTKSGTVTRNSSRRWRAGNGSLMRLAPVPMVFAHDLDLAACASGVSSLTTHPVTECREACATYGRLIAGALRGWERDEILAEGQRLAGGASSEPLRAVLSGAYLQKSRDEISSSGYVIATMEAALWAFAHAADFESGALMAVNLGHDADTVGAVYGQLAGAHFGYSDIPTAWIVQLFDREGIVTIATALHGQMSKIEVAPETARLLDDATSRRR